MVSTPSAGSNQLQYGSRRHSPPSNLSLRVQLDDLSMLGNDRGPTQLVFDALAKCIAGARLP